MQPNFFNQHFTTHFKGRIESHLPFQSTMIIKKMLCRYLRDREQPKEKKKSLKVIKIERN